MGTDSGCQYTFSTMAGTFLAGNTTNYNRLKELRAFDESKAGVKGLVDAGITKLPPIFIRPPEDLAADSSISGESNHTRFTIPVVDLADERDDVVSGVRRAAETVGFFQVVNHGVKVLEEMVTAAREFHGLPQKLKAEYYTREKKKKVKYESNFDLYRTKYANWRDTLFCVMGPESLDPQQLPLVGRDITIEYSKQVQLISNDQFKSVEHRVVASDKGPRVSVACFFTLDNYPSARIYGPIKELLSKENPQFIGKHHCKISMLTIIVRDLMEIQLLSIFCYNNKYGGENLIIYWYRMISS
ncbi:hypothetical protein VNO77_33510 [Canavalia gladiata]|uniref:Uncharacterized protein n=1 Tax=Canavalia gladiata TaxID=3824 RepID=A0AAN9KE11_CANGL